MIHLDHREEAEEVPVCSMEALGSDHCKSLSEKPSYSHQDDVVPSGNSARESGLSFQA